MQGKIVVVTGASGALGKVVAEMALARGARVAGVDHAASQIDDNSEPDRTRRRRSVGCGAGQEGHRRCGGTFRRARRADQYRRRLCVRGGRRGRSENLAAHVCAQRPHRAERVASGDPASGRLRRRPESSMSARWARCRRAPAWAPTPHPKRRASPYRGARRRMEGQDHRQCRAAVDHRHPGQSRQHAQGGFREMGDAAGTGGGDPVSC